MRPVFDFSHVSKESYISKIFLGRLFVNENSNALTSLSLSSWQTNHLHDDDGPTFDIICSAASTVVNILYRKQTLPLCVCIYDDLQQFRSKQEEIRPRNWTEEHE